MDCARKLHTLFINGSISMCFTKHDIAVIFHHFILIPLSFDTFKKVVACFRGSLIENTIGAHLLEHLLHQNAIKSIINISTMQQYNEYKNLDCLS